MHLTCGTRDAPALSWKPFSALQACIKDGTCAQWRFELEALGPEARDGASDIGGPTHHYRISGIRNNASWDERYYLSQWPSGAPAGPLAFARDVSRAALFHAECRNCPGRAGEILFVLPLILLGVFVALLPSLHEARTALTKWQHRQRSAGVHGAAGAASTAAASIAGAWPEVEPSVLSRASFQFAWALTPAILTFSAVQAFMGNDLYSAESFQYIVLAAMSVAMLIMFCAVRPADRSLVLGCCWQGVGVCAASAALCASGGLALVANVRRYSDPSLRNPGETDFTYIGSVAGATHLIVTAAADVAGLVVLAVCAVRTHTRTLSTERLYSAYAMCVRGLFALVAILHLLGPLAVEVALGLSGIVPSAEERSLSKRFALYSIAGVAFPTCVALAATKPRCRTLFHNAWLRGGHHHGASVSRGFWGGAPPLFAVPMPTRGLSHAPSAEISMASPGALAPPPAASGSQRVSVSAFYDAQVAAIPRRAPVMPPWEVRADGQLPTSVPDGEAWGLGAPDLSHWLRDAPPRLAHMRLSEQLGCGGFARVFAARIDAATPTDAATIADASTSAGTTAGTASSRLAGGGGGSGGSGHAGGQAVAVKLFLASAYRSSTAGWHGSRAQAASLSALEAETRLLSEAAHPNIVCALGRTLVTIADGRFFPALVMELCAGGSLDHLLHASSPWASPRVGASAADAREQGGAPSPPDDAPPHGRSAPPVLSTRLQHSIALDVAAGLAYLHSLSWMHRDVKPANVLLHGPAASPRAKLGDFGLATRFGIEQQHHKAKVGTVRYMAPEVRRKMRIECVPPPCNEKASPPHSCPSLSRKSCGRTSPPTRRSTTRGTRTAQTFSPLACCSGRRCTSSAPSAA